MNELATLKQEVMTRLKLYNEATVPWRILEDMLEDPDEEPHQYLGVSKNEMIMLAGHRRPESLQEQFDRWCEENGIWWSDNHQQERIFRWKTAKRA